MPAQVLATAFNSSCPCASDTRFGAVNTHPSGRTARSLAFLQLSASDPFGSVRSGACLSRTPSALVTQEFARDLIRLAQSRAEPVWNCQMK